MAQKNIGTHTYSGFGGPVIKFTEIYQHTTPMLGGKGAFLYDNEYYIGGAGYSIVHNNDYLNNSIPHQKYNFSYLGLLLGHLYKIHNDFHLNTQLLLGSALTFLYMSDSEEPVELSSVDFGFVTEGEVGVVYDINHYVKAELSGGFRYVHPSEYFRSKDLNSYSVTMSFWFGRF